MNLSHIARLRLNSQQISATSFTTPVELVKWFGAVQGQEFAQSKWGLGLRLRNLTDQGISKDFNEGKILRTHLLRPTWHLVAAEDIRWLLMLTAPRVHAVNGTMYRQTELTRSLFSRCNKILTMILSGGNQLTRDSINEEFERNGIKARGHRLSYIMMQAELDGLICSGAMQGKQFTYALLDERVKATRIPDREQTLATLTSKYFASRGPATVKDFSTWSGLTLSDCRKGIETTGVKLLRERVEGEEYFFSPELSMDRKVSKAVHLLPVYDEFIMGYQDRSAILLRKEGLKGNRPFGYDCTVVVNGQISGTWRRTVGTKGIDIQIAMFQKPDSAGQKALNEATKWLEEFTGIPVKVRQKLSRKVSN